MKITSWRWALALWLATAGLACAEFNTVSLKGIANRELEDQIAGDGQGGWSDQGVENCLTGFPRGQSDFAGVPFDIPESGPAAFFFKSEKFPTLPETVTLPVPNVKAGSLDLLLTYVWGGKDQVGAVTIEHSNGKTEEFKLMFDRHVAGWWGPSDHEVTRVAWRGHNGLGKEIGVYLTAFKVSQTDQPIRAIKFSVTPQEGSLVVLGVTLGTDPPKNTSALSTKWEPVPPNMENWFPVKVAFDSTNRVAWEAGFQATGPAGSRGWIKDSADGHFQFDNGTPVRFWGLNYGDGLLYPPKEDAPMIARRTAKYGFNLVRFHPLDGFLIEDDPQTSRKLNTRRLDRMDFLVNELKKEGIYVNLSVCYVRHFKPQDGVVAADKIANLNNEFYFLDARAQELYLEFLKAFLDHKNPYTGLRNADDPAIAVCSVMNESNMFFNSLENLTSQHKVMLLNKWNDWLLKKYGAQNKLIEAWSVPGQGTPFVSDENLTRHNVMALPIFDLANVPNAQIRRVADQTRFYYELQDRWFHGVSDAIRATGSKMLVTGTGWYGPGHLTEIDTAQNATLDYVDKHTYWDHGQGGWTPMAVTFRNRPMAAAPAESQLQPGFQRVAGKPFVISEWNCVWPNDYTLEGAPIMAAYGALQGWDGFNQFACSSIDPTGFLNGMFDIFQNPSVLALEPLAHFLFVRGDVQPAPLVYRQALDDKALHDPTRKRGLVRDEGNKMVASWSLQSVPTETLAVGKVELALGPEAKSFLDTAALSRSLPADKEGSRTIIQSVTGELTWDHGNGTVYVNTPRTTAIVGRLDGAPHPLGASTLVAKGGFGAVHLSSLDAKPLGESRRILITAVGRVRNTGQSYETRNAEFRLRKQGDAPLLMEPVELTIDLKTPLAAWRITAFDGNGQLVKGSAWEVKAAAGVLHVVLSNRETGNYHFLLETAEP